MRLKQLRKWRRLSQVELAARAGLSRPFLARLETGRQDPSLTTLQARAKALGVKLRTLIE